MFSFLFRFLENERLHGNCFLDLLFRLFTGAFRTSEINNILKVCDIFDKYDPVNM